MQRDGFTLAAALLALVFWTVFTHGDDDHIFLLGIAAADVAVLKFALLDKARRQAWAFPGLLALAAAAVLWLMVSQCFPARAEGSRLGPFLEGMVPSLGLGGLLVWVYRGAKEEIGNGK